MCAVIVGATRKRQGTRRARCEIDEPWHVFWRRELQLWIGPQAGEPTDGARAGAVCVHASGHEVFDRRVGVRTAPVVVGRPGVGGQDQQRARTRRVRARDDEVTRGCAGRIGHLQIQIAAGPVLGDLEGEDLRPGAALRVGVVRRRHVRDLDVFEHGYELFCSSEVRNRERGRRHWAVREDAYDLTRLGGHSIRVEPGLAHGLGSGLSTRDCDPRAMAWTPGARRAGLRCPNPAQSLRRLAPARLGSCARRRQIRWRCSGPSRGCSWRYARLRDAEAGPPHGHTGLASRRRNTEARSKGLDGFTSKLIEASADFVEVSVDRPAYGMRTPSAGDPDGHQRVGDEDVGCAYARWRIRF